MRKASFSIASQYDFMFVMTAAVVGCIPDRVEPEFRGIGISHHRNMKRLLTFISL
jgi:hypothetical protein